jgi:hypothetical protein
MLGIWRRGAYSGEIVLDPVALLCSSVGLPP